MKYINIIAKSLSEMRIYVQHNYTETAYRCAVNKYA